MAGGNNKAKVGIIALIVVMVHAAGIVTVMSSQTLQDFFFGGGAAGSMSISGDYLEEIVDDIRAHTRNEWYEQVDVLDAAADEIGALRDDMMARVRDEVRGAAYHAEMEALLGAKHAPLVVGNERPQALAQAFERAKDAERRLINAYIDIIAARNALSHDIPAIDAVTFAKVVQPTRSELDDAVLGARIRSQRDGRLDAFRAQVTRGSSEIDAMVKYAASVLENVGLENALEEEGIQLALEAGDFGSAAGDTLMPDQMNPYDLGTSDGGFDVVGGRIISGDALANHSIYIDKWYVMGPFENRFRSAIDASFLPESVVDLDHTTIGKGGKEIGWEYWRSPGLRIEPQHAEQGAVYYAWTELFIEEAGPYWVSMGSDDYGKMWVNGELVWSSGTEPKAFRADEETMEIDFKQGVNEILFRCENGGGTMGWSVVFHTGVLD